MNRRHTVIALLALGAAQGILPIPVLGQARIRRVALLTGGSERALEEPINALRQRMKDLGYLEGRNFAFETRFGEYSRERTAQLAAEIIASKPDVLLVQGVATLTVAALTKSIPLIVIFSGDLVDAGLVKSLARPGGNVSGIQYFALELVGKRIEILKEIAPSVKRLAVIADPGHPVVHLERDESMRAAKQLGLSVTYHAVKNPQEELAAGLAAARAAGAEALVVFPDGVTLQGRERIAAFALQHKLPAVFGWETFAVAGGLVSYGPNLLSTWRNIAGHLDRVLKGADPATLPVELPTVIELVVNRKTARALGMKIPQSLLVRADRVID